MAGVAVMLTRKGSSEGGGRTLRVYLRGVDPFTARGYPARMAENKTHSTDANVAEFLATVPDPRRRDDARDVVALMSRVTGEPAVLWGTAIIGFGLQHYVGKSGR